MMEPHSSTLARLALNAGSTCAAVGALLHSDAARAIGAIGPADILVVVVVMWIPTILWFVTVVSLLAFRAFERRKSAIAHLIVCVCCAIPAAIWILLLVGFYWGSDLRPFVVAGIVCVVIGSIAPWLQYVLRDSSIGWRRSVVIGAVSMAIAIPLGARAFDEIRFAQHRRASQRDRTSWKMGRDAKAGDFARFAAGRTTMELRSFVDGYLMSTLYLGPEPLGTTDAAAVQAYLDDASFYDRRLHAKLVASRHRTTASLVADKDAAALHYALLELLERNKGALFCDDPPLLRTRMDVWFAADPQAQPMPITPRIAALCN